jgi:hypothetical protein
LNSSLFKCSLFEKVDINLIIMILDALISFHSCNLNNVMIYQ